MAFSGEGEPQHLSAMQVTPEFLPTLGVRTALGRGFSPSEGPESDARVAVLSYGLWQGMYRGAETVLGQPIRLNGRNYTIVGVMPQQFHFLYRQSDVWVPLSLDPPQRERGWRGLRTVARLKPGVSVNQADAEVRAISARVAREDPKNGENWSVGASAPIARSRSKPALQRARCSEPSDSCFSSPVPMSPACNSPGA
jgi:putative ABC transport system permease protein